MFQAGALGVRLIGTQDEPLQVHVGGVTYILEDERIDGAALPSNLISATYQFERARSSFVYQEVEEDDYTQPVYANGDKWGGYKIPNESAEVEFIGGGVSFGTGDDNIDISEGDLFSLKFENAGVTEYVLAQRGRQAVVNNRDFGFEETRTSRMTAKLFHRCSLNYNDGSTGNRFTTNRLVLTGTSRFTPVRCGHIFVDPTTARWTIAIERRVAVVYGTDNIPNGSSVDAGTMVYVEANGYWYRSNGNDWVKTNRVYLGVCAIEGGRVQAVVGVRTPFVMEQMNDLYENLLPDEFAFRFSGVSGGGVSFSRENPVELRPSPLTWGAAVSQETNIPNLDTINVSIADDGIKENNRRFYAYVEIGDEGNVFYEDRAPTPIATQGNVMYVHPHRAAIFIGGFLVDNAGNVLASTDTGNGSVDYSIPWLALSWRDTIDGGQTSDGIELPDTIVWRAWLTATPAAIRTSTVNSKLVPLHKAALQAFFRE